MNQVNRAKHHLNKMSSSAVARLMAQNAPQPRASEQIAESHTTKVASVNVLICLLGSFRVLKRGQHVAIHSAKTEALLRHVGLHHERRVPRERILEILWPGQSHSLAVQSLNSLIHSMKILFEDVLDGQAPIMSQDRFCLLNKEAGVSVDMSLFDAFVVDAERSRLSGDLAASSRFNMAATFLYGGDLIGDGTTYTVIERERLRVSNLRALTHLADYRLSIHDYAASAHFAERILAVDPCNENAHRLLMRCYVRLGERAQALHQYRLCEQILHAEFEAAPEAATTRLYHQIRLNPESV